MSKIRLVINKILECYQDSEFYDNIKEFDKIKIDSIYYSKTLKIESIDDLIKICKIINYWGFRKLPIELIIFVFDKKHKDDIVTFVYPEIIDTLLYNQFKIIMNAEYVYTSSYNTFIVFKRSLYNIKELDFIPNIYIVYKEDLYSPPYCDYNRRFGYNNINLSMTYNNLGLSMTYNRFVPEKTYNKYEMNNILYGYKKTNISPKNKYYNSEKLKYKVNNYINKSNKYFVKKLK